MLGRERFHGASERENSQEFAKIKKRRLQKTDYPEKTIQSQCVRANLVRERRIRRRKIKALIRCPLPRFSKRRTLAKRDGCRTQNLDFFQDF
jgi:hypothetical protein